MGVKPASEILRYAQDDRGSRVLQMCWDTAVATSRPIVPPSSIVHRPAYLFLSPLTNSQVPSARKATNIAAMTARLNAGGSSTTLPYSGVPS